MLSCIHTHKLWDRLFQYFHKQTRTRARQLRVELPVMSLESNSIQDYLLQIRLILDALTSIGDPLLVSHHIDVILESFPSEFAHVVSLIQSKFSIMDLDEVEIMLVAHELRLIKLKKVSVPNLASLNLTHAAPDVLTSSDYNIMLSSDSSAP